MSKGAWLVNSTTTASQNTFGGAGATPRHPHLRAASHSGIFAGRNWPRRLSAGVHCRSRVRVWIITAGPVHPTTLNPARVRVHLDGQVMWARTLADTEGYDRYANSRPGYHHRETRLPKTNGGGR